MGLVCERSRRGLHLGEAAVARIGLDRAAVAIIDEGDERTGARSLADARVLRSHPSIIAAGGET